MFLKKRELNFDMKEKWVKVCPKCGSKDITIVSLKSKFIVFGIPTQYRCNKCGYLSFIIPEIIEEIKK